MVVVFSEENAREYLHEDDDGDETRCTENLPYRLHRGLGDGEEVSEAFFRSQAPCWRQARHPGNKPAKLVRLRSTMLRDTQTLEVVGSVAPVELWAVVHFSCGPFHATAQHDVTREQYWSMWM